MTRTDIHRPSVLNAADYHYICMLYSPSCGDPMADALIAAAARRTLQSVMQSTGAKFSHHKADGCCGVCGTRCMYYAVFRHVDSNCLIRVGIDCTAKMFDGDEDAFRPIRAAISEIKDLVAVERRNKAGRLKAAAVLELAGQQAAWDIFTRDDCSTQESRTIVDMVGKLVRYGALSQEQHEYIDTLLHRIQNADQIEADRRAAWEAAEPVPAGRQALSGLILSVRLQEGFRGYEMKCLLQDDRGFKIWMTLPAAAYQYLSDAGALGGSQQRMKLQRVVRMTCTATLEQSSKDAKFGFGKRPSSASIEFLDSAPV